ncbi:hypothetical protein Mgra_00006944, partial [Meloidogyne graminicola]
NPKRFKLLNQIVNASRSALIIENEQNYFNKLINKQISLIKNNWSKQEIKLNKFGVFLKIINLLEEIAPISNDDDLPWEEIKNKSLELIKIIKELEYGENKFKTKVLSKIAHIVVKIMLKIELNESDRYLSSNLRIEMRLEEYYQQIKSRINEFIKRQTFREFINLHQKMNLEIDKIIENMEEYLKFGYLPSTLRVTLFFYLFIAQFVDLLDENGKKRINFLENIKNENNFNLIEFTYIYTS